MVAVSTMAQLPTRAAPGALTIMDAPRPSRALATVRGIAPAVMPASPATDLTVRRLSNRLESLGGNRHALTCAFTDDERADLQDRSDYLADRLQPGDPNAILRSIGMLRVLKGEITTDDETRAALMNAHLAVLGHFPAWAVEAACQRFMRSKDRFAPDPGELAEACESMLVPHRAELRRLEHILDARVEPGRTDAEREAVKAEFDKLMQELAANADPRRNRAVQPGTEAACERAECLADLARRAGEVEGSEESGS